MITFVIIMWLLIGLVTVWREYQSAKKYWWTYHKKTLKDTDYKMFKYIMFSMIISGPYSFYIFEIDNPVYKDRCWYFNYPNQPKLQVASMTQEQFDYWFKWSNLFGFLIGFVGVLPQSKNFCPYWLYLLSIVIINYAILFYYGITKTPKDHVK